MFYTHSNAADAAFATNLKGVKNCQVEKSPALCSLPFIKSMLKVQSGAQTMDGLVQNISLLQCHFVGHVVGQQLYINSRNIEAALQQCNRQCDSACIHGVIGEAFAEELGFGNPASANGIDFEHLNRGNLMKIGRTLCVSAETCHGVGHTVFQVAKKIGPAMALCADFAPREKVVPCYNGVTMEYADILTSKSMRSAPGVTPPSATSLRSLCLLSSPEQKRACFRYFERYVMATLQPLGYSRNDALAETRKICESFSPGENRISCMTSMGSYYNLYVVTDPVAAKKVCDEFMNIQDKAACILGEVFVAVSDRKESIAKYCTSFPNDTIRRSCYQSFFSHLAYVGEDMSVAHSLCETADAACEAGLKDYKLDSWDEIRKL